MNIQDSVYNLVALKSIIQEYVLNKIKIKNFELTKERFCKISNRLV